LNKSTEELHLKCLINACSKACTYILTHTALTYTHKQQRAANVVQA
jgi:hypothetical protein